MSKKRFTDGLESLFAESPEGPVRKEPAKKTASSKRGGKDKEDKTRSSGKDFSSDLASFLQEAFESSFEQQLSRGEPGKRSSGAARSSSTGLDALIRNTLEPASLKIDPNATRRLVVAFNESQLSKLKKIARLEKTVLKKIINEIVEDFISEYENSQGKIE